MKNRVVKYFVRKRNIALFLAFVYVFALVFILVVNPFGVQNWLDWGGKDRYVFTVSLVVGIGFLVLLISRVLMYLLRNKIILDFTKYLIWVLSEIFSISVFCTLYAWLYSGSGNNYFDLFPYSLLYTSVILITPYTLSWFYIDAKESRERNFDAIVDETIGDDKKSEMLKAITETEILSKEKQGVVNFNDDKGQLKFSVDIENLLYLESSDNYVNIYYLNHDKIARFVLRATLKSIEENYANSDLVRCHRSFMVNFKKVKVLHKERNGLFIDLDIEKTPEIPVSGTYAEPILKMFTKHSL